jgi:glycosyltransferase involved in cell wall biosynthesis
MLRHADRAFYLNPDLGRYLPGASFLPYANVDVAAIEPVPLPDGDEVIVVHAPTDRDVKGTSHAVAAVEALRAEGLPVRLDLVEGVSHADAIARLATADVVLDQLLIGWYGGVAVEAMALGRPVVSYVADAGDPFGERLPITRADPATVRDRLRELVLDRGRRERLAAESRAFALAEHDPRAIARRVLDGLVPLP